MSHFSILPRQDALTGEVVYQTRFTFDADVVAVAGFRGYEKVGIHRTSDGIRFCRLPSPMRGMWRLPTPGRGEVTVTYRGDPRDLGLPASPYRKVICATADSLHDVTMSVPDVLPDAARLPLPVRYTTSPDVVAFRAAMSHARGEAAEARALDAFRAERAFRQLFVDEMVAALVVAGMTVQPINERLYRINGQCSTLADLQDIYRKRHGLKALDTTFIATH